jgi:hypothetical protein
MTASAMLERIVWYKSVCGNNDSSINISNPIDHHAKALKPVLGQGS